jgi:hypothetical protein
VVRPVTAIDYTKCDTCGAVETAEGWSVSSVTGRPTCWECLEREQRAERERDSRASPNGPASDPQASEGSTEPARDLYVNIAALLAGGLPDPPMPELLHRDDGHGLFYVGELNYLFGDPESGKTWVALAAVVDMLRSKRSAIYLDLDRNGAGATVHRLLKLGASPVVLGDRARFRYAEPEDAEHLDKIIVDAASWRPALQIIDSVGELLPLYGLSSSNPDEFTNALNRVVKPLLRIGATALAIDHLAEAAESRAQGATGTAAKRRTIGGTSLRVSLARAFAPGDGGSCYLRVHKDRHGGLRAHCAAEREPVAGTFELDEPDHDGILTWRIRPPSAIKPAGDDDVAELEALDPPPTSQRDVQQRMGWGGNRALAALQTWRAYRSGSAPDAPE